MKIELSKKEMLDPIKHLSVSFESEYSSYGRNYDILGEISNNALATLVRACFKLSEEIK